MERHGASRFALPILSEGANFSTHSCTLEDMFLNDSPPFLQTCKLSWSYPVSNKHLYSPLIKQTSKTKQQQTPQPYHYFQQPFWFFPYLHSQVLQKIAVFELFDSYPIFTAPSTITWPQHYHSAKQRSANFFCKDPDGKYFWFCRPYGFCCNYSALLLQRENRHRQYINKWY